MSFPAKFIQVPPVHPGATGLAGVDGPPESGQRADRAARRSARAGIGLPLMVVAGWFLSLAALRAVQAFHWSLPLCTWRVMTGIPCPTCGGTRALLALTHLDLVRAFRFNPLVCVGALAISAGVGLWLVEAWCRRGWVRTVRAWLDRVPWLPVGLAALFLNWIYVLVYVR